MKVAVMQPYLFPYLGYVNLLHVVDHLVVLDDVNFIKRGWINRNRFLVEGEVRYLTLPIEKASQNRPICAHRVSDPERAIPELRRRLALAFARHPDELGTGAALDELLLEPEADLVDFLERTLRWVGERCGVQVEMSRASQLGVPRGDGPAADRIMGLVRQVGGTTYVNLPGGRELYSAEAFVAGGLDLRFVEPALPSYEQRGASVFVPGLSILDLLFNAPTERVVAEQVAAYELVES